MSTDKLIVCHFTLEELEYINAVIVREQTLTKYVRSNIEGLVFLGVELPYLKQPNMLGKLLSYINKGRKL